MLNPMDLTGKTILVTGASSGIGRATAILLSRLGARLVLVARNVERLTEIRAQLEEGVHFIESRDLNDVESIPDWMKSLAGRCGKLHGLMHSAGIHEVKPLRFLNMTQFEELVRINVTAGVALTKGLRQRQVRADSASVVFVSSVMGLVGQPGVSSYCASKGALISLARSLALELAGENVRVNAIAPGQVRTEMTERQQSVLTPEQFQAIEQMHPLGLGNADDVAHAAAFLLSEASRWITGTTLVVDGGYTAQ